jgi:hypothetical protein
MPERLTPLYRSPWFQALPVAARRRHNQLYALLVTELFIWAEQIFAIRPITRLLADQTLPASLCTVLASFVADEEAHTKAFWHLLQTAEPAIYPTQRFALLTIPSLVRGIAAFMGRFPARAASWILIINFLEEHTLILSRAYGEEPGLLDPLFAEAHSRHAVDEARHCHIDGLLAQWLLAGGERSATWLNTRLLGALLPAYRARAVHGPVLARWLAEFPKLLPERAEVLSATEAALGPGHMRKLFDRTVTPITYRNQERYGYFRAVIAAVTEEAGKRPSS